MTTSESSQMPGARTWPALSLAEAHARLTAPGQFFEMEEKIIRGMRARVWKNAPPTLRDAFLAGRAHGDKTFLVYEGERASFEGFARAALAFSHALLEQGLRKGDRVAIAMRNLPEWPVAFYGAALAGAIVAPLNAWWTGTELAYGLADSGAKFLVADEERLSRVASFLGDCQNLQRVYVTRAGGLAGEARVHALESVIGKVDTWPLRQALPVPDVPLDPEDDLTIFYTSGTTGTPKGAVGTHRNMMSTIVTGAFIAARTAARRGDPPAQPNPQAPQKALLLGIPLFHVIACHGTLSPALFGGAKLVIMRKWDAESAMRLVQTEKITDAGGVPTNTLQLLEHPARRQYDLSSLQSLSYGGAPSQPAMAAEVTRSFPNAVPVTGWGMTETSGGVAAHSAEDVYQRPSSCGAPVPVCEVRIVGPNGEALPVGEVGELQAKGPNIVRGYWNQPEATAQTFVDGWVRTGDLARLDAEGFCYIVDRAKDVVIRGGENVYCVEVENTLGQHPAVAEAAIVAVAHRTLGEEPAAVVSLRPGVVASEEELRAFVANRLAAFKVPVRIVFWPEPLPRNPTGKVLKLQLAGIFAAASS